MIVPRVLVVIVSSDDAHWLSECLHALASAKGMQFDVVVVANACSDHTVEVCQSAKQQVRLIRTATRMGFAEANNIAIYQAITAGYEFVFLLNPDTRVASDAVDRLVTFLGMHPEYAILGSLQFEYGDDTWTRWNTWSRDTVGHARDLGAVPKTEVHGTCLDHFYVQGAALMFRLRLVPQVGLLDTFYGTFYEETDLCRRCRLAGFRVGILFDSRVQHFGGGNWKQSRKSRDTRCRQYLRNQFFYYISGTETVAESLLTFCWLLARQLARSSAVGKT